MACYGNDWVETPNLNRLADESFVFRNAYCTQPVCTPSRASILTGLWPHIHGCVKNNVALAREAKTIAEILPPQYRCGHYGKWHLGDEIVPQRGFDDWISIEDDQCMELCAKEAVQILGGAGYIRGAKCERIFRETKVIAIGGGAEEIMKDLAARQLGW